MAIATDEYSPNNACDFSEWNDNFSEAKPAAVHSSDLDEWFDGLDVKPGDIVKVETMGCIMKRYINGVLVE